MQINVETKLKAGDIIYIMRDSKVVPYYVERAHVDIVDKRGENKIYQNIYYYLGAVNPRNANPVHDTVNEAHLAKQGYYASKEELVEALVNQL